MFLRCVLSWGLVADTKRSTPFAYLDLISCLLLQVLSACQVFHIWVIFAPKFIELFWYCAIWSVFETNLVKIFLSHRSKHNQKLIQGYKRVCHFPNVCKLSKVFKVHSLVRIFLPVFCQRMQQHTLLPHQIVIWLRSSATFLLFSVFISTLPTHCIVKDSITGCNGEMNQTLFSI